MKPDYERNSRGFLFLLFCCRMERKKGVVYYRGIFMERAVIYCRVSTEEITQIDALQGQIEEAKRAVAGKRWVLADSYIDEGKSGTTTKRRDEYNRLFSDLTSEKFDIIVVKSQDRLMRNTKEWYIFVDQLVQSGKQLYFYMENKFYTPDDALITGIKAILAEEFSRDLSKKINNAHRNRQSNGGRVLITSNTWGYDKINKEVIVNEKEAEVVKLIFELCLQGYGSRTICKELDLRGIKGRSGNAFPEATVRKIIRNPLFMGTAVMNKMHYDFNAKKAIHNPKEEWILHENAVPALVSEEVWVKANAEIDKRSVENGGRRFGRKGGNSALSSKIICGECGEVYWKRFRRNAAGGQIVYWSCSRYVRRGRKTNDTNVGKARIKLHTDDGCDNIHLKEEDIQDALYLVAEKIFSGDRAIVKEAMLILEQVLADEDTLDKSVFEKDRVSIMAKREALLDKMLDGIISEDLFKMKDKTFQEELAKTDAKIAEVDRVGREREELEARMHVLKNEVFDIADKNLSIEKVAENIQRIRVFPGELVFEFDLFPEIRVFVNKVNNRKVEMRLAD